MVYLIFGSNTFFARRKVKEILEERKKFFEKVFPIFKFHGKNLDLSEIEDKVNNAPLFAKSVFILIEEIWQNQKFKEEFLKRNKKFLSPQIILIFFEKGNLDKKDPFFKLIQKIGEIYEFSEPDLYQIKKFIKRILREKNFQIEEEAQQILIDYVENDLWKLYLNLQKLMAYRNKEKIIKKDDVLLLVNPSIDTNIFRTIDALAERNKKQALKLIYKHLQKGESPLYILSMIKYQFKNLLVVKEKKAPYQALVEEFKDIHPFVLKKASIQSRKFTLDQLKKFYRKIFKIELAIKRGRIAPEEGLELLVLDL